MLTDSQIEWCREHIPGFKAMHDQAEKARKETEASREWARNVARREQREDAQS